MKKIFLLSTAFAFSLGVMAQGATKSKPTKPVKVINTPVKEVPTSKVTGEVKPSPVQPATAQSQASPDEFIKMNTLKYDFGKIKQGVPVTYFFEIKNVSDKAIVIENTYASCGCTTPERIAEPIAPGATAKLKVQYNAHNMGAFNKDVHIKLAGIAQEKVVYLSGEVVADPAAPAEQPKANN